MNRYLAAFLAGVLLFVECKLILAAIGAVFIGLAVGSLAATLAGCVGLGLSHIVARSISTMLDDVFHPSHG